MLSSNDSPASHRLRLIDGVGRRPSELVPEDYYIEPELPLILNAEPKTYGKRLASSSVQTEGQDNNMSILAADKAKKSRSLLRRKRKNKTQLNIRCDPVTNTTRPKSANSSHNQAADDSLLATSAMAADELSIIEDVVTSDDLKWRTCTIQTDSESVIVNYVIGPTGNDDGYVSGSGDLAKQANKSGGVGALCGLASKHRLSIDSDELETDQATAVDSSVEVPPAKEPVEQLQDISESTPVQQESTPRPEVSEPVEPLSTPELKEAQVDTVTSLGSLSKAELKARKELERKLKVEAKKRQKEEDKAKKTEEKEAKKRAKEEAKRAAEQAKKAAKEAKQKAQEDAKRLKKEKDELKMKKKLKQDVNPDLKVAGPPESENAAVEEPQEAIRVEPDSGAAPTVDEADLEALDLTNMTPVSEEIEVQKFVEEVVGDDGVVTKTTKTVETKLVTLRQEELRSAQHRELPIEEYEQETMNQQSQPVDLDPAISVRNTNEWLEPELEEIVASPSCFSPECKLGVKETKLAKLSPKAELKKRIKLNEQLVKQAKKFSTKQLKRAEQQAQVSKKQAELCKKELEKAQKLSEKASKESAKSLKEIAKKNKKMDKKDKKLAKRQKKIDKKEKELNKKAEKQAKKEAKRQSKLARQASTNSKASSKSSASSKKSAPGSRKSIRLEDIGDPVLRSSSRLSIGGAQASESELQPQQLAPSVDQLPDTGERASPVASDDLEVEMSLDDVGAAQPSQAVVDDQHQEQLPSAGEDESAGIADEASTEPVAPESGQLDAESNKELNVVHQASEGAQEAPMSAEEQEEQIDVVNDLPQIGKIKRKSQEEAE